MNHHIPQIRILEHRNSDTSHTKFRPQAPQKQTWDKDSERVQTLPMLNTDLQLPHTQTLEYKISKASETSHPEYKPQRPQTQILEHRTSKSSETSP